ncbi:MAG: HEAT repeat domain-containing protein [Anaerolineae bacterium]|nr:HEAT repeat domain-containing protein [Chloroflexota bacterium]MBP6297712.1 HEAT repeat domain-containing protein [Anaerolineae bacterium]
MGVKEQIRPVTPSFPQVLAILTQLAPGQMIPATVVRGLSDLQPAQVIATVPVWRVLDVDVKRDVIRALIEAGESDFETDYSLFGMLALDDDDALVRSLSIDLCAYVEGPGYFNTLFEMAQHDPSEEVQAVAMKALGAFILQGELGQLPAESVEPVVDYLFSVLRNTRLSSEVRARALESIGNSSNQQVVKEIRRAYRGDDPRLKTASINAMGSSGDDQWTEFIIHELERGAPENRFEAARAAGELSLQEAVRSLSSLVFAEDSEIVREAVWALGEIGGKEAVRVLEALLEQVDGGDDDLADLVEDALDNANASAGYVFGFDSPEEMN